MAQKDWALTSYLTLQHFLQLFLSSWGDGPLNIVPFPHRIEARPLENPSQWERGRTIALRVIMFPATISPSQLVIDLGISMRPSSG